MCDFAIRDAYPQAADFSVDEDDGEEADLDIDSDASDADLLELKQELDKLGNEKAQRDLADATIAAQEMTLRRWERYCEFRAQAFQRPDITRIQEEKDALAQKLKDDFGTIKNGSKSPDGIKYTRVQSRLRASKMRAEREAFTKLLRDFHSTADLDHMVTQLNGEEPASQMLDLVQHILEERRQLAQDLFQPGAMSSFARMVDTMARLCSLSEGKDHRYSSHKGDNPGRTIKPHACTQLSSAAVDEPVYSADSIDLALDLHGVKPLEIAKPTKTVKSTKAMKLATSSKSMRSVPRRRPPMEYENGRPTQDTTKRHEDRTYGHFISLIRRAKSPSTRAEVVKGKASRAVLKRPLHVNSDRLSFDASAAITKRSKPLPDIVSDLRATPKVDYHEFLVLDQAGDARIANQITAACNLVAIKRRERSLQPNSRYQQEVRHENTILDGISFLHEQLHKSHGDITCATILLDRNGRVKIGT
ncbi:MAG: hypothetical protein L6R37_008196 [Teloschistes peruensis]|nr:MAG: hypothetical protein L6R37_008196 [Teloschistes peruensis]